MYGLKWVRTIPIVIGLLLIFYAWSQTWSFTASPLANVEEIKLNRTIRSYVFGIGGLMIIFIGLLLRIVDNRIGELIRRNNELKQEIDDIKQLLKNSLK